MTIDIRIAAPEDVDAIFAIRTEVRENHLSMQEMAALSITPETVREDLAPSTSSRTWIAEFDREPVGFSVAHPDDGNLFALFIRTAFEGRGIGRRLLALAGAYLFESHDTIWLETDGASRASGFYRRLGWETVAELPGGDIRMEKRAQPH
ncbi:GNAT family N-acetyltransferase [Saccharopolyspora elongata]|uniref:N-acetyltransferase n=1 Tax=Saccharopolyspora elongata TaxID=2530387 RepID=A0A4R4YEB4_9PSEU|nr:GNAT family N-acetyltransferase [Saccharopolyspora elongata]TDD42189.1 N-acetyltransferase [Saccharopolyspora elongata]